MYSTNFAASEYETHFNISDKNLSENYFPAIPPHL